MRLRGSGIQIVLVLAGKAGCHTVRHITEVSLPTFPYNGRE
jgi:hypothetical protein